MSEEVIVERSGGVGTVRLNRPKALNALTLPMVRAIRGAVDAFAADASIAVVLMEGEGERAFCAGGDIRAIYDSGKAGDGMAATFWREEYELNAAIARFPKPFVVFMHGIVMGGGAGLSIHASHRVVTETTRFAMPEVGIGFIPDVGATWRLTRLPGGLGRYLALTGTTVGAADILAAGLADAMVPSERLADLRAALIGSDGASEVDAVVASHRAEPAPGIYAAHSALIDDAFAAPDIEDVLESLEHLGGDFARETRALILTRSPSSLRDTDELLRLARRSASLEECLTREFWAALGTLDRPDFYEGVRAAVIDKDRNPRWSPASLAETPSVGPQAFVPRPGVTPPFSRTEPSS